MNQSTYRLKGRNLLIVLSGVALAASLTIPVTLAQSSTGAQVASEPEVAPSDADAIDAAIDTMPLFSAKVLDALSDDTRANIERLCLPVQYQSGAVAYRECISEQLDAQPSTSAAKVPQTSLSFDEEFAIQQACRDAGSVDSAAYHACDEAQLASLDGIPEPALDQVTEDDTYAIQLNCYDSQTNDGVKAYRECINESIAQLLALPQPDLLALTLVERNALQLRCSAQNTSAVAYRNCLLDAVNDATVATGNVDDPSGTLTIRNDNEPSEESPVETSLDPFVEPFIEPATESSSEPSEQAAPQADDTAAPEITSASEEADPVPATDGETATDSTPAVEADAIVTTRAIRLPSAENMNQHDSTDATGDAPEISEVTDDPGQSLTDLLTRLQTTITGMNDMTRLLMWTAIGLPILLTLIWLVMRGRKPAPASETLYSEKSNINGVDTAPHRPSSTHRAMMINDDTAEVAQPDRAFGQQDSSTLSLDDDNASKITAQIDELFGKSESEVQTAAQTAAESGLYRESETTVEPEYTQESPSDLDLDLELVPEKTIAPGKTESADFTLAPATQRDDYLAWLSVQDETKQQTLAIEFLIYWMAYSDERYSPELKRKIFQLQNPDDHELIKRWTLKQDVHAFAGNLQWLQYNLNTEQHEQIINLLIALLVSENALTPAQNTLLRFLADAFGLGAQRLDTLFQAGFAHPMPPLPRLDNPDWWKAQSADSLKRWDARSVSRQNSEVRYRVALGLPLGGQLDPDSIMASFKRASNRCQPEGFDRLSSREQNLVARQLEKYEIAAESLLEVSA